MNPAALIALGQVLTELDRELQPGAMDCLLQPDGVAMEGRRDPRDPVADPSVQHAIDLWYLLGDSLQSLDLVREYLALDAATLAHVQPDQRSRVSDLARKEGMHHPAFGIAHELVSFPDIAAGYHVNVTSAPLARAWILA